MVLRSGLHHAIYSSCAWQVGQSDTTVHHCLDELQEMWSPDSNKDIRFYALDSMPVKRLSNVHAHMPDTLPTGNGRLANENPRITAEIEKLLSSIIDGMLLSKKEIVGSGFLWSRYITPQTSVAARIDELILGEQGDEFLLVDRQEQAEWLKQVMAAFWGIHLPQPFIGFDLDEGLFVASWQSDQECNTLTIDAKERKGWYDPWPASDNPLPEEVNLETEEAWERLRSALTTTRP